MTARVDMTANSVKADSNELSRHPAQQGIQSGQPRLLSQGTGAAFSETESVKAVSYPYFPFYVKDFVADIKVQAMNTEAIGAYLLLLCAAWQENPPATLPQDDLILAAYCRLNPSRWQELKPAVLSPFRTEGRRYVQNRLRQEFRKIEALHAAKSRGGQNRWSPNRSPNSSPPLRAYGSDSGSESGSSGEGVGGGGDSPPTVPPKAVIEWVAAAYEAFPSLSPPVVPSGRIVGQVIELVCIKKHTLAQLQSIATWVRTSKTNHKPNSPTSLLDPERFEQWLVMSTKENDGQGNSNRVNIQHGDWRTSKLRLAQQAANDTK